MSPCHSRGANSIWPSSIDRVAPLVLLKCLIKAIEEVRRQPASPRVGGWEERACWRNDGNGHGCVCLSACRVPLTVRGASRRGRGPSRPPSQHPRLSSQHTADTHRSRRSPPCGGTPPADQAMRPSALPAPEGWVWSSPPTFTAKQQKRQNHAAQKRPRSWQNPIVDILWTPAIIGLALARPRSISHISGSACAVTMVPANSPTYPDFLQPSVAPWSTQTERSRKMCIG